MFLSMYYGQTTSDFPYRPANQTYRLVIISLNECLKLKSIEKKNAVKYVSSHVLIKNRI